MAREDVQFNYRMPKALKDMLEAAAEGNKRSMTAEINARLERSFAEPSTSIAQRDSESPVPVMLSLDRKLSALCSHLGVKFEN